MQLSAFQVVALTVLAAIVFALSAAQVSWVLSLVLLVLLVPASAWNILRYLRHCANIQRAAEEAEKQKADDNVRFRYRQSGYDPADRH